MTGCIADAAQLCGVEPQRRPSRRGRIRQSEESRPDNGLHSGPALNLAPSAKLTHRFTGERSDDRASAKKKPLGPTKGASHQKAKSKVSTSSRP